MEITDNGGADNLGMVSSEQNLPSTRTESTKVLIENNEKPKDTTKNVVLIIREGIYNFSQNNIVQNLILPTFIHLTILGYVTFAVLHWLQQGRKPQLVLYDGLGLLLAIAIISYWSLFYYRYVKPFFRLHSFNPLNVSSPRLKAFLSRSFYFVPVVVFVLFLIYDVSKEISRLRSLSGLIVIFSSGYFFSKYPSQVRWDIVYRGIVLQVIMALCTVRWPTGKLFFEKIGDKIETFLSYSYVGAAFVYSDNLIYQQIVFAFQCLSVIFFVNFIVEVLFHLRILQKVFTTLGWFLQKIQGTTPVESVNCCVSVFLGLNEAMLVIKPYMARLTMSELQAVMLGQLSTVAGSVFAAYVSFGVNPGYLVTASLMSAPAALSFSKLVYPETEASKTKMETLDDENNHKQKYRSALSAGCEGALSAIGIVTGIIATLIAFISLVAFADAIIAWLAMLIGFENVTLVSILGKLFIPVAYLIGVDPSQCYLVGELISTKVVINEFVAYRKLGQFKSENLLSARSEAIATYALCSFSNPGSVASQLAMISAVCPSKLEDATMLSFRAFVGGIVTCFITASIAGLLITVDPSNPLPFNVVSNSTNATMLL